MTSIVKDVYDSKLICTKAYLGSCYKKPPTTKQGVLSKIKESIDRGSVSRSKDRRSTLPQTKVALPEQPSKFLPASPKAGESTTVLNQIPPAEELKLHTKSSAGDTCSRILSPQSPQTHYANNHPKHCKFVNPDPVVVMASVLNDLVLILNKCKSKGVNMFHEAKKVPQFEIVEKQIAAFREPGFVVKGVENSKEVYWLQTNEERLCFFLNLYNFLILFALCKNGSKPIPKTQLEWTNYEKSISIKVANSIFTAFEIEHAVLRAAMNNPKMPSPSLEQKMIYPKFQMTDPRIVFALMKKDVFINFAFYIPTKSSPSLKIYLPSKVSTQMKDNATRYLQKTLKVVKSIATLPALFEWYSEDFIRGNDKDDLLFFIANCLPKESAPRLKQSFTTSVVKEINYDKYDWTFAFDYSDV